MYWKCPECLSLYQLEITKCPLDGHASKEASPIETFNIENYKNCPCCKNWYKANTLECPVDETDLTRRPIGVVVLSGNPVNKDTYVKMCSNCGTINSLYSDICENCGEDISDCEPVLEDEAKRSAIRFKLVSIDNECTLYLDDGCTILGTKETLCDYLKKKEYVCSKQSCIMVKNNKIWIRNLGKTNPTFVNDNEQIADNEYRELHSGDIIGLGGGKIKGEYQEDAAFFRVETEFICSSPE